MGTIREILSEHKQYGNQLVKLAKADIERTYRGATLGWAWAIIKPASTIFVFWFTFTIGLRRGGPIDGYPFFLWLITGLCPWFYMSEMLNGGAGCIRKYNTFVTKMKFPVSTIPTFFSMSSLAIHWGLLFIVLVIFRIFHYKADVYWLQIPFYMALMFIFFTFWALFAGMVSAMSKDFMNLVKSIVTAIFWLSGILYDPRTIEIGWLRTLFLFNPVTYFVNGYRNCLIQKKWFWETGADNLGFLLMLVIMIIASLWAYKKLRKDIPDVL